MTAYAWRPSPSTTTVAALAPDTHTWLMRGTAALVFLVFFACEQNLRISLATAYTQSLEEMESTAQGGNALRRIMFLLLAGAGAWLAAKAVRNPWRGDVILGLCIAAVPAWCGLSVLWTQDTGMCMRRLIVLACFCCGAFGVGRFYRLKDICWCFFAVTMTTSVLGVLAECGLGTFRPWTGDYRFSGTLHPNSQGMYLAGLALSAFTLARLSPEHRWKYLAAFGWGFTLLVLTKSRTATAGVIVAVGCLALLQMSLRLQIILGATAALTGAALYLTILLTGIDPERDIKAALFMGREEQAESFTGRGEIWPEVMYFIQQRPIAGFGYESFWTPEKIEIVSDAVQWAVREAHSGYLDVILSVGVIGLALVLIAVLWAMGRCAWNYARSGDPCYAMLFSLFVFGLIDCSMESGLVTTQLVVFFGVSLLVGLATNDIVRGRFAADSNLLRSTGAAP